MGFISLIAFILILFVACRILRSVYYVFQNPLDKFFALIENILTIICMLIIAVEMGVIFVIMSPFFIPVLLWDFLFGKKKPNLNINKSEGPSPLPKAIENVGKVKNLEFFQEEIEEKNIFQPEISNLDTNSTLFEPSDFELVSEEERQDGIYICNKPPKTPIDNIVPQKNYDKYLTIEHLYSDGFISVRIKNVLTNTGYTHLEDLYSTSFDELMSFPNMGRKSARDLFALIKEETATKPYKLDETEDSTLEIAENILIDTLNLSPPPSTAPPPSAPSPGCGSP